MQTVHRLPSPLLLTTTPAANPPLQGPEHEKALALAPKVPTGWPRSGAITFDRVVMKYAPHLPPALRGVSFNIKSGEKVGRQHAGAGVGHTGGQQRTLSRVSMCAPLPALHYCLRP